METCELCGSRLEERGFRRLLKRSLPDCVVVVVLLLCCCCVVVVLLCCCCVVVVLLLCCCFVVVVLLLCCCVVVCCCVLWCDVVCCCWLLVVVEWLYYSKRIIIVRRADLIDFFSSIFVGKMCIFVSRPMKIDTFFGKTITTQNGLLNFLWKETHSETKSWKSSRTLTKKVTTTTVNLGNCRGF